MLVELGDSLNNNFIFTAGAIKAHDLGDCTMVGGAGLVHLHKWDNPSNFQWTIGSELTQFDADADALAKAAEFINVAYSEDLPLLLLFYIFSNNNLAISAILNPHSKTAHSAPFFTQSAHSIFYFFQGGETTVHLVPQE